MLRHLRVSLCLLLLPLVACDPGRGSTLADGGVDPDINVQIIRFSDGRVVTRDDASGDMDPGQLSPDAGSPDVGRPVDNFGLPIDVFQAAPVTIKADDESAVWAGAWETADDALLGRKVFARSDNSFAFSEVLIPVDPSKRYRVSGSFRSVGEGASLLYFGLAPYTDDPRFIWIEEVNRVGTPGTVSSFDDNQITTIEPLSGWSAGMSYQRLIGFYYDGRINRLPDWVWIGYEVETIYDTDPELSCYSQATGNQIWLNEPIPAGQASRIIPGTTKVMNHSSGGTYLYTAAAAVTVPETWTHYEGEITGASFAVGDNTFRPETAYVRFLLLLNHAQGPEKRLHFTDLKIEEVLP